MAPWSMFVSRENHRFVLSSTQWESLLLESNNENTLEHGKWDPSWVHKEAHNPKFFYNRVRYTHYYSPLRLYLMFMRQNKHRLPGFFMKKLSVAFPKNTRIILVGMGMYYLMYMVCLVKRKEQCKRERVALFPALFFLNIVIITLIFHGEYRYIKPFMPFFLLPAAYALFQISTFLSKD
jgi:hypothetical protein